MESTYREFERRREHSHGKYSARRGSKAALGPRERRRLLQLGVCVVLFLVVFIGKSAFPGQMDGVKTGLAQILSQDTDFRDAFASLGRSISRGEPVLETLGDLCVDVFGGSRVTLAPPIDELLPSYQDQKVFLNQPVTQDMLLSRCFQAPLPEPEPEPEPAEEEPAPPPEEPAAEPEAPAEPAVTHVDYTGPALPENATMDRYALGLAETMCPVSAEGWWVSSGYGWREHPLDGGEKFHNGIDMAVNDGTPVLAFADGTVDYIGESPIYGLYTQIRHANGVTSFYAHNSKLCVQQGQSVKMGDKIAESGESGNVTGPHLHFELKKDGVLLNPGYYVDEG